MDVEEPDVMSWLLEASKTADPVSDRRWLSGDSRLIIVAGRYADDYFPVENLFNLKADSQCT